MSPSIRTVPTASGATAVQVIWGWKQGRPTLDHIGSAHTEHDLALLKARAQRLIDGERTTLDLGLDPMPISTGAPSSPVPVTSERAGHLIDAIHAAYTELAFDQATDNDQVFKNVVTAWIVQPGSKIDSIETLAEIGVESASYATIKRRLPIYSTTDFRDGLTRVCAAHAGIGPGVLVLYDVTTLYFETDEGDDFRKPGFPRNAAWSHRTPLDSCLMPRGSRCRSAPTRATWPKSAPCCR